MEKTKIGLADVIEESKLPVLAEFTAEYCGYCKRLAPAVKRLSEKYGDKLTFYVCDTEKEKKIAEMYEITGVPSFMLFVNGEATDTLRGPSDAEEIENWLQSHNVI